VAGLVLGHLGGLVDDEYFRVGFAGQDLPSDGQADDAGTDHGDIVAIDWHGEPPRCSVIQLLRLLST
jgi:hypothetical protein